jgi:hypothetical protein
MIWPTARCGCAWCKVQSAAKGTSCTSNGVALQPLAAEDEATLRPMHELLTEGLAQLMQQLRDQSADADDARGREIQMNRLEARTRGAMLARMSSALQVGESLPLLALSDAYEVAGNQLFRMAEVLERSESHALENVTDDEAARVLLHMHDAPR